MGLDEPASAGWMSGWVVIHIVVIYTWFSKSELWLWSLFLHEPVPGRTSTVTPMRVFFKVRSLFPAGIDYEESWGSAFPDNPFIKKTGHLEIFATCLIRPLLHTGHMRKKGASLRLTLTKMWYLYCMSRPLRIEYPYAWYHVMNRARRGDNLYTDKDDLLCFIRLMQETVDEGQEGTGE